MSQRWVLCFSNLFLWKSLELEYYSTESDPLAQFTPAITLIYNISIPILFHFPHMPINSTLTRFYHSQNTRGNLQ